MRPIALFLLAAAGNSWWAHVQFLASDQLQGRQTGSKGYEAAADYVVRQFERAGLKATSQPVEMTKTTLEETKSNITLVREGRAIPVTLGEDAILRWDASAVPDVAPESGAPLVFAGYGLDIPEAGYSDFKDPALRGAIVVYLTGGPSDISGNLRSHYSSAGERARAMRAAGAIGWIAIPNPRSMDVPWPRLAANRLQPRMSLADPAFQSGPGNFIATWNPAKADELLEGSGHSIAEILDAADHNRPLPHFSIPSRVRAHVATHRESVHSRNVVGVRPGTGNEIVIVSAHLDALFKGALDNAAGVASLIEIARGLKAQRVKTRRSIVFLAVTGEEQGELGSQFFADHPTVPGRIVADINMDMVMPLFPLRYLEVQGLNESTLGDDIRAVAAAAHVEVQADKEP